MAVLTCALCGEVATRPLIEGERAFCCHGCRELWHLLGPEGVAEVKSRPGVVWEGVRAAVAHTAAPDGGEGGATSTAADAAPWPDVDRRVRGLSLRVDGMWCASCAVLVESVLGRTPGVLRARVDFATGTAALAVTREDLDGAALAARVEALGYRAHPIDGWGDAAKDDGGEGDGAQADLLRRFAVAATLGMFVMMFSVPVWSGYLPSLPPAWRVVTGWGLAAASGVVVFWAGLPFLRGAWASVRHGVPTMDLLVALGSLAAYAYSLHTLLWGGRYLYFDTAAMLVAFLLLGRAMEAGTLHRATAAVRMLASLMPREALRLGPDGEAVAVAPTALAPGDRVLVRAGGRIPADGEVVEGEAAVDESFLTGEALAGVRRVGDRVYAGALSVDGRLVLRVDAASADSVLAQTARFVRAAEAGGGRLRRAADRILRVFVPAVLAVAAVTFAADLGVGHMAFAQAMLHAVAVLVVACPCALSVATPLAVLAGADRLSRLGVLVRDDAALERAARIDDVVWDKTGTLTDGRLWIEAEAYRGSTQAGRALALAAAVEAASSHPVAAAIRAEAERRGLAPPPATRAVATPGMGVDGVADGVAVRVAPLEAKAVPADLAPPEAAAARATLVGVWLDGALAAVLALADRPRPEAAAAVARLRTLGYRQWLFTGDGEAAARHAAAAVGLDPAAVRWRLSPADKAVRVAALRREGRRVAFVGDGVNDAPALAGADLGLAMGSGADIAAEAGHMVLAAARVDAVPDVLGLSRRVAAAIRLNLAWALAYNVVALPAAALGFASPTLAAAAMLASSAFVLGNSLRLTGFSPVRYARGAVAFASFVAVLVALARFGL